MNKNILVFALITINLLFIISCDSKSINNYEYQEINKEVRIAGKSITISGIEITNYKGMSKKVEIPMVINEKSVVSIGERAFQSKKLTDVLIPDSVIIIGQSAFYNNGLVKIEIPESVLFIDAGAFNNNPIMTVVIENQDVQIEHSNFSGFGNLFSDMTFPGTYIRKNNGVFLMRSS